MQVSEEKATEAACGALYLAGLKSMKTEPPYEVHVFRTGGLNYEQTLLLTDVCWKQWDITKKLVWKKKYGNVLFEGVTQRKPLENDHNKVPFCRCS